MIRTAVIGLGLIGGSLALALKKYTDAKVVGYDQCDQTMELAAGQGAIDVRAADMAEAVAGADIIFFALAPSMIGEAVKQTASQFKIGAIVTDVASAKGVLLREVLELLPAGVSYIAGHPMAGSERNGFTAAHAELFRDRPYILMDNSSAAENGLSQLAELVSKLGAKPVIMESSLHDPAVASISHVPHITAAALTVLAGQGTQGPLNLMLAAGGFRDMTRVASANPAMWADICLTNRLAIDETISQLQNILEDVRTLLDSKDHQGLMQFFVKAKEIRDKCQGTSSPSGR